MKKIIIKPKSKEKRQYPMYVGSNLLSQLGNILPLQKYSQTIVITDTLVEKLLLRNTPTLFGKHVSVIQLPHGERAKNIEGVEAIWKQLSEMDADRKSLIINIGGGVICDIGGFAASTYMRGVDFINIPTTLLAQIDASIGGKTGINFDGIKNLVGTFTHPIAVIIDVDTLVTLPQREFTAGFAEIIKHGLIADKKYFSRVTAKKPREFTKEELIDIIIRSEIIKKNIFEKDPTEKGLRKLLNFGHTVGHAIEAICLGKTKPLLHGEAISIGMLAESYISLELNLLTKDDVASIKQALMFADLPISTEGLTLKDITEKMKQDKKNEHGIIYFTLLDRIGKGIYNQKVPHSVITKALQQVLV